MQKLHLSLVQADLVWENIDANLQQMDTLLRTIDVSTDLVVLPEMFTTGFSMQPAPLADTWPGKTTTWMQAQAKRLDAALVASAIIQEEGRFYNRLIWAMPNGDLHYYDKRHLFTLAGEHKAYTAGTQPLVMEYKGWKIMPLICYDVRFPVWSRNVDNYDLLLYVANFPEKRSYAWRTLLKARAIENQSYTVGLNRVGFDGNGIYYSGDSTLIGYDGRPIVELPARTFVQHVVIDKAAQDAFRSKFAFLQDRDDFNLFV